jgi:hypothetical protein
MYDVIVSPSFSLSNHPLVARVCSFTFFIYLFHAAPLNILKKIILLILGKNETGYLVCYLTSPWIFIFIAVIIGLKMKKYIPKFYNMALGGR